MHFTLFWYNYIERESWGGQERKTPSTLPSNPRQNCHYKAHHQKILSLFPSSSYTYDSSSNSTCDPVLQQSSRHVWTQLRAVFIPECSHPISLRVITLDIFLLITCSKDGIQRHFAHPNTFSRAIKVLFHSLLLSKRTRGHRSLLWLWRWRCKNMKIIHYSSSP